jgi:hypothetical protein
MVDNTKGYLPKVLTGDRSIMKAKIKENMITDKALNTANMSKYNLMFENDNYLLVTNNLFET